MASNQQDLFGVQARAIGPQVPSIAGATPDARDLAVTTANAFKQVTDRIQQTKDANRLVAYGNLQADAQRRKQELDQTLATVDPQGLVTLGDGTKKQYNDYLTEHQKESSIALANFNSRWNDTQRYQNDNLGVKTRTTIESLGKTYSIERNQADLLFQQVSLSDNLARTAVNPNLSTVDKVNTIQVSLEATQLPQQEKERLLTQAAITMTKGLLSEFEVTEQRELNRISRLTVGDAEEKHLSEQAHYLGPKYQNKLSELLKNIEVLNQLSTKSPTVANQTRANVVKTAYQQQTGAVDQVSRDVIRQQQALHSVSLAQSNNFLSVALLEPDAESVKQGLQLLQAATHSPNPTQRESAKARLAEIKEAQKVAKGGILDADVSTLSSPYLARTIKLEQDRERKRQAELALSREQLAEDVVSKTTEQGYWKQSDVRKLVRKGFSQDEIERLREQSGAAAVTPQVLEGQFTELGVAGVIQQHKPKSDTPEESFYLQEGAKFLGVDKKLVRPIVALSDSTLEAGSTLEAVGNFANKFSIKQRGSNLQLEFGNTRVDVPNIEVTTYTGGLTPNQFTRVIASRALAQSKNSFVDDKGGFNEAQFQEAYKREFEVASSFLQSKAKQRRLTARVVKSSPNARYPISPARFSKLDFQTKTMDYTDLNRQPATTVMFTDVLHQNVKQGRPGFRITSLQRHNWPNKKSFHLRGDNYVAMDAVVKRRGGTVSPLDLANAITSITKTLDETTKLSDRWIMGNGGVNTLFGTVSSIKRYGAIPKHIAKYMTPAERARTLRIIRQANFGHEGSKADVHLHVSGRPVDGLFDLTSDKTQGIITPASER